MNDVVDITAVQQQLNEFAEVRDWVQFHSPKNLSMALAREASELLEIFQWMTEEASLAAKHDPKIKQHIGEELSDILLYAIRIADRLDIHLNEAIDNKMEINGRKYPTS